MSKKIVMLLFLMLVLISVSAVSAADMDDNADTIVSSADAETIAVSNDVDAIDDLSENDAGGDDKALANDAKSVAAGKNSDDGAYENSTSQLLATSDENNVLENENGGEILKETSSTWYVDANAASGGDGSIVKPFKTLKEAINKVQDYDVIKIAPGTYEGGNNIELTVNKIVSLERYGDGEAIFDADKDSRVLKITAQTVNITGLTFKNGKCDGNGGAVYFEHSGTVTNCTFIKNQATDGHKGGAVYFGESGIALNSIFTDNRADDDGGAIFEGGAINCTFTGNSANDHGGAIHHGDGNYTAVNCTFNNNAAGSGGATYGVDVVNCNFNGNKAKEGVGGAVYFGGLGTVTNCNFTDNQAPLKDKDDSGGAIYFNETGGNVTGSNFIRNKAFRGGAIHFESCEGNVSDCNFVNNTADVYMSTGGVISFDRGVIERCNFTGGIANFGGAIHCYGFPTTIRYCNFYENEGCSVQSTGGAICFANKYGGNVSNCNFSKNFADHGGAIYVKYYANIIDCNFDENRASSGGAIICYNGFDACKIKNCYFIKNLAYVRGGAINLDYLCDFIYLSQCVFIGNSAQNWGGAICTFEYSRIDAAHCDFINNTANNGGALYSSGGTLNYCNFTGNKASEGSAIYYDVYQDGSISNSVFLDNRAGADYFDIVKKNNNVEITFVGNDNIINAIISIGKDVKFNNVTYWGENGIMNTGSVTMGRSDREPGQNITVNMVVNDIVVIDKTYVTDRNGKIVLDLVPGNITITATHEADSYYTRATKTQTFEIPGNETSLELSYSNFTIEASITPSNISGNITFRLKDDYGVVRTVESTLIDGVAKIDISDWPLGEYEIEAVYKGDFTYYPSKSTMIFNPIKGSFSDLRNKVDGAKNTLNLSYNFIYDEAIDVDKFLDGIVINKTLTINGNDIAISGNNVARIFNVTSNAVLTLKNVALCRGSSSNGGAVYVNEGSGLDADYVTFENNVAEYLGGALYCEGVVSVSNSNFTGNVADKGSAIYNDGTLSLNANKVFSDEVEIVNGENGIVSSTIRITVMGGKTVTVDTIDAEAKLNATITDDNGNLIEDDKFKFTINGDEIPAVYNAAGKLYEATYFVSAGIYPVGITYVAEDKLVVQKGTVKRTRGSYTDLQTKVNEADGELVLEYDFAYTEVFDGDSFKSGVVINKILTINGNGHTISGNDKYRIFYINATDVVLNDINFIDGMAEEDGGAIYNKGKNLTVTNCSFKDNLAKSFGGAIYNVADNLNISGCIFENNEAFSNDGGCAGAIYTNGRDGIINNCSFVNNHARFWGGAIRSNGQSLLITECIFEKNKVQYRPTPSYTQLPYGGAIYTESSCTIGNSIFADNFATFAGGGIFIASGFAQVHNCSFMDNSAEGRGGAIRITGDYRTNFNITHCIFLNNQAPSGSAIENDAEGIFSMRINNNWFGNNADNYNITPDSVVGSTLRNWLYLNASAENVVGSYDVKFILMRNDGESVDNNLLPNVDLTISSTKGSVDKSIAQFNETIKFVPAEFGTGSVTARINGVRHTIAIDIPPIDTSVSVNNDTLNLFVDDTFTIVATTDPSDLDVTYVIDNSGVVSVDDSGVVTALKEGTASIIVKVGGEGVYAENSTVVTVTVSKVPTVIEVNSTVGEMSAGAMGHVAAELNPSDAGNLTYVSNDTSVATVSSTGVIKANKAGTAMITVSFNGTDKYAAAENKTIVLTVNLNDASVSVNNSTLHLKVNDTFTIVAATVPADLNVTYVIDNSGVVSVDDSGVVTALKNGTASIIVKVGGDGVYAENTTIVTVTVFVPIHTEISVANATVALKVNENVTAGATLTPAGAGNLTYTSSNSSVAIVENGTIKAVGAGNATITVSFTGNDKYAAAENKTINVTVSLNDVIINVKNSTVELVFGDSFTINATTVPEGLNLIYVPDESGIVSVDENGVVTTLKPGIAKILVKFNGNDVYAANSTVVTVKVGADKVIISPEEAFNFTSAENSTEVISVNLPEDATGFVLLDINGTKTHVPLVNGKANVSIPKLAEGIYNATVTYTGDDFYAPITTTKEINVVSNVPKTALSIPDSSKSDVSTKYSISLPGDAGGYLEVDVDGKQYSAPVINGSASISIPALSPGNHEITVKYSGDKNYSPVTKETTLKVTAPVFKLSKNKNVAALYSAKATYKVLVTRDGKSVGAGQVVTMKFNGKTYTVKTDKNGYASLKLNNNVKVKKYTITAEYKGVKVTNKVTINHVIKAANKKVKKSRKVTKVKVSLKKINGKYLKGKTLKIKFKGKTYKVKTNKKGTATWKVKKSMLKNLKAGKKYKYTVTYGKDVVTKKLTIKK